MATASTAQMNGPMFALHPKDGVGPVAVDARPTVTEIFREHHGFVCRVLGRFGVAPADQQDALQEVFVVVHRRLGDYQEQSRIRAWLYAICARVAKDHRRRVARRREHLTESPPEHAHEPGHGRDLAKQQSLMFAERLIDSLPEKQRAVFVLYEVEQMPMSEVAAAVGCPIPTAYGRLHKARERVMAHLARARLKGEVR